MKPRRAEWLLLVLALVPLAAFAAAKAGWLLNPERVPEAMATAVTLSWVPALLWLVWVLAVHGRRWSAVAVAVVATPFLCVSLFLSAMPRHAPTVLAGPRTDRLWVTEHSLIGKIYCHRTVTPRADGWLLQPLNAQRCWKYDGPCWMVPDHFDEHEELGLAVLMTPVLDCMDTPGPMALDLFRIGPDGVARVPLDGEPAYGTWERDAAIRAAVAATADAAGR